MPQGPHDVVTTAYNVVYKPVPLIQTILPMAKVSCSSNQKLLLHFQTAYNNLAACMSNPAAFVERKKSVSSLKHLKWIPVIFQIVSYVPILRGWLPFEEDAAAARPEMSLPNPISQPIQEQQLKRLMEDDGTQEKADDTEEVSC